MVDMKPTSTEKKASLWQPPRLITRRRWKMKKRSKVNSFVKGCRFVTRVIDSLGKAVK